MVSMYLALLNVVECMECNSILKKSGVVGLNLLRTFGNITEAYADGQKIGGLD